MARGTTDESGVKTVFFVNPFMKKDEEPWLKVIGKINDKWIEIAKEKWISGFITDIKPVEMKYKEGVAEPGMSITMTDFKADEAYVLRIGVESGYGRDLILRLANAADLNVIMKVKVYQNDKGYNGLSLRLNETKIEKLHDREWELSLTKEVEDGGKKIFLRGDLNKAIAEIFANLVKRYNEEKVDNSPVKDPFQTSNHAESIYPEGRGNDLFDAPPVVVQTMDDVPPSDDLPF